MMPDTEIKTLCVLRRNTRGSFDLVVRWLLGDEEALPRATDTFRVTARVMDKKLDPTDLVIFEDGRVGTADGSERISVEPRLLAMIDPPRRAELIDQTPDGDPAYRMVAVVPHRPVEPAAPGATGSLLKEPGAGLLAESDPVGIVHLLEESEPSRAEWRVAKAILPTMVRTASQLRASSTSMMRALDADYGSRSQGSEEMAARQVARYLSRTGTRPLHLPGVVTRAVAQFRSEAIGQAAIGRQPQRMPEIFDIETEDIRAKIDYAALVASALNDAETLEVADREFTSRKQTRQHLRLRALQGGELIDFWCDACGDPNNPKTSCVLGSRGKRYSAAELTASGLTITGLTAGTLTKLVEAKQSIRVEVEHEPGPPPSEDVPIDNSAGDEVGNLGFSVLQVAQWSTGKARPLTPRLIRAALRDGGSDLPPPPTLAIVNFDLRHDRSVAAPVDDDEVAGEDERLNSLTAETGDGKVQILIGGPHESSDDETTVFSYNLYGVWEGAPGMGDLFDEAAADPAPEDLMRRLKPFRISARYSYQRDLSPAFPSEEDRGAVEASLADPPWFPIMRAPDATFDTSEETLEQGGDNEAERPARTPLPPVARDGLTATTVDLRKGLDFGAPDRNGYTVNWDPFGKLETNWSPETDREGNAAGDRPQRYRFWVTSVDAFDQESAPVPVAAHDADAGEPESHIFCPRFRTPLAPPRRLDAHDEEIEIRDGNTLVVRWITPLSERIGTKGEAPQILLDKTKLVAQVALYRRRIRRGQPDLMTQALSEPPDLPQWRETHRSMQEQGFVLWKSAALVGHPAVGDTWEHSEALAIADRDHEYVAAIGFEIAETWAEFWAPSALKGSGRLGRRAIRFEERDDDFVPVTERVVEAPRFSDISVTKVRTHLNENLPRSPEIMSERFDAAQPVLPIEGIQRDLVLLRLLGHQVVGEGKVRWQDTCIPLTSAQALMCETAIRRVKRPDGSRPKIDDAQLADLRRLLATGLSAGEDGAANDDNSDLRGRNVLSHHPTLGFRGIQSLTWQTIPFPTNPADEAGEAEAAAVRIYQARVPFTAKDAEAYATLSGTGTPVGGGPVLALSDTVSKDPEALQAIATRAADEEPALSQPSAALVYSDLSDEPSLRVVRALDLSDPARPVVALDGADNLPALSRVFVFAAHELVEKPVDTFSGPSVQSIQVPVGGGLPEAFVWWLVSVSAKGAEAPPTARPVKVLRVPMTIEPEAPGALRVGPPLDATQWLNPEDPNQSPFLPSNINDPSDPSRARLNPRLIISWTDPRPEIGAVLVLRRRRRAVDAGAPRGPRAEFLLDALNPWDAIKAVEGLQEGDGIPAEALDPIARTWLLGLPIAPSSEDLPSDADEFIVAEDQLSSENGLIMIPGNSSARPAFVDYHYDNFRGQFAMEGSWLYSYSAARAIDLDPYDSLGLKSESGPVYLMSRSTGWSPFYLPSGPSFKIKPEPPLYDHGPPIPPSAQPEVEFRFRTRETRLAGILALDTPPLQLRKWFYRIVIRRRIDAGMPSDESGAYVPQWIEVGEPIELEYAGVGEMVIRDRDIDRAFPTEELSLRYRISVTQMALAETADGNDVEVLVRRGQLDDGADLELGDPVVVPAMSYDWDDGNQVLTAERRVTIRVLIDDWDRDGG